MIAVSVTPFGGGAKSPVLTIGPQPGDNWGRKEGRKEGREGGRKGAREGEGGRKEGRKEED
jgi:hypothetical protein